MKMLRSIFYCLIITVACSYHTMQSDDTALVPQNSPSESQSAQKPCITYACNKKFLRCLFHLAKLGLVGYPALALTANHVSETCYLLRAKGEQSKAWYQLTGCGATGYLTYLVARSAYEGIIEELWGSDDNDAHQQRVVLAPFRFNISHQKQRMVLAPMEFVYKPIRCAWHCSKIGIAIPQYNHFRRMLRNYAEIKAGKLWNLHDAQVFMAMTGVGCLSSFLDGINGLRKEFFPKKKDA